MGGEWGRQGDGVGMKVTDKIQIVDLALAHKPLVVASSFLIPSVPCSPLLQRESWSEDEKTTIN